VTLAVSPGTAAEDGSSNLVYTFTRTGVTTNALTVNYTVGGTASLGTDYTGIAATPATKTVSFAAGASTALVTVDPTVDSTVETDETVALTLAAGTGYTVGTTTAVVGTISNDDVASAVTATLATNQSSLALTGTANTNGTGNATNNIISGNSGDNILDGKDGVDTLTGLGGADTFLFSTVPNFGASTADHITDFNAGQGDLLGVSRDAFGIPDAISVSLTTANSDPALSTAFSSDNIFVYDSRNGNLYFNQNGSADGFGSGGVFAVIDNKPDLIAPNISLA
jgi:Ca2+-binding RTX toxin-like protein